jgi:hypothetical protein
MHTRIFPKRGGMLPTPSNKHLILNNGLCMMYASSTNPYNNSGAIVVPRHAPFRVQVAMTSYCCKLQQVLLLLHAAAAVVRGSSSTHDKGRAHHKEACRVPKNDNQMTIQHSCWCGAISCSTHTLPSQQTHRALSSGHKPRIQYTLMSTTRHPCQL